VTRAQLEHILRAASTIAEDDEIIVIGSQAILGQFPNAPDELLVSNEADVYPRNHEDRADLIDGSIGELSPFHDTYGYYAQGVGRTTAVLPDDWESRLVRIQNANTRGAVGLCLEVHDLIVSKLVAGRDKDIAFARVAIARGLGSVDTLRARIAVTPLSDPMRAAVEGRLTVATRPG
jgi:hypothetical protein